MRHGRFRPLFLLASVVLIGTVILTGSAARLEAQGTLPYGTVVALQGTPHLWFADEQGILHWGGDTRALSGRYINWNYRAEVSLDQLRTLPIGDPWLSAGLLKDGDPIYLVKWESDWQQPQLLHIQSIDDVELFGINSSNYGRFVLDRTSWEQRFGIATAGLQRGRLARAVSLSSDFVPLSSGLWYTCALRADGTPVCWGQNVAGEASPPPGEKFVAISSGVWRTCALRTDGTPVCWGASWASPASPPLGEKFAAISSGEDHTCALRTDGTPVCWGWRRASHLYNLRAPSETFVALSTGRSHTCALRTDGTPVCWGWRLWHGQASPPPGEKFAAISSGSSHTCALRTDGSAVCWGQNDYGQASPPLGEKFAAISSGGNHNCALRADGTPVCWGQNDYGQASPPPGEKFAAISSGGFHTCALRADGSALCWGGNEKGMASPPPGETFASPSSK